LLLVKFEEIMLYLLYKYKEKFEFYLFFNFKEVSPFKNVVESNVHSNLKLEEIAFLCNMSLSTFKRHFIVEYNEAPGGCKISVFKEQEILKEGQLKLQIFIKTWATTIFLTSV
jgi:AraC-like DNA-binding protein